MAVDRPIGFDRLYQELVEAEPDAVLVIEAGAPSYLLVNDAAVRLLGYARDELLRMGPRDLLEPGQLARLAEAHREFERDGGWRGEWRLRRKDGQVIVVEATNGRHTVAGRVFYQGCFRDVTARRTAEHERVRREAQLAEAQWLARFGSWDWDVASGHMTLSDELYRIFGEDPSAPPPPWAELRARIPPQDAECAQSAIEAALASGGVFEFVARIMIRNDECQVIHSRGAVLTDEDGKPERMVGATEDITDRVEAEQELRRREQEFRALVEQSPDVIIRVDQDLCLVYVNPAGERALGAGLGDLLGKDIREIGLPTERAIGWELALRQVFRSGLEQTTETTSTGGDRQYQARLMPILNRARVVGSVLCVARDLTERYLAERERERLYQELTEREHRLQEMVGQILRRQADRRGDVAPERGQWIEQLTPQERQILRLLADGHSGRQIAHELGLSPGTVRNRVSRLLPKLGAVDRTHAVALAIKRGLLG
jgi:PAS domain S-box-containing protein